MVQRCFSKFAPCPQRPTDGSAVPVPNYMAGQDRSVPLFSVSVTLCPSFSLLTVLFFSLVPFLPTSFTVGFTSPVLFFTSTSGECFCLCLLLWFFALGHCPGKPMEVPDSRNEHTTLSSAVTTQGKRC